MIDLFMALYCEARVLIGQFGLMKNGENTRFQEFYNEEHGIRLTVTGVGEIAAAMAVTAVCTKYKRGGDFLVNIGLCGGTAGMEGIFLCNKLTEEASGKTFYPDLLYRHDFREAGIVTGMRPWNGGAAREDTAGECLYDMEAAAVYQAGIPFFGPHRMMFLKIVSDSGAAREVTPERAVFLMEKYRDDIVGFLGRLSRTASGGMQERKFLKPEDEAFAEQLSEALHCSRAMRDSLRQYIRYFSLAGEDYRSVVEKMYAEDRLPCRDKREGKKCFEELKRRLL